MNLSSCIFAGQGSKDSGQPAAGSGVFRQGQMVQHPGSRLEPSHSTPGHRPACPPARPLGLVSGLFRLPWRRWTPKLPETFQLVDEGKR